MNSEIVDYKKKYEAVLQTAKQWISDGCTDKEKIAIEAVFPELRESEDERTRKALIETIDCLARGDTQFISEDTRQRYLAWLEMQKEYISNNFDDIWSAEGCEELIAEGQKLTPKFIELFKKVCHAWYDKGFELSEKQKPKLKQNTPRWRKYGNGACGGSYDFAIMRCGERNYMLTKTLANGDQYLTFDDLESLPMED